MEKPSLLSLKKHDILPNEKIVHEARKGNTFWVLIGLFTTIAPFTLIGPILIAFPPLVLLGPAILLYVFLVRRRSRVIVTDKRVIKKISLPFLGKRSTFEVELSNVKEVSKKSQEIKDEQWLLNKLTGTGKVRLKYKSDEGIQSHTFTGVKNNKKLKEAIHNSLA